MWVNALLTRCRDSSTGLILPLQFPVNPAITANTSMSTAIEGTSTPALVAAETGTATATQTAPAQTEVAAAAAAPVATTEENKVGDCYLRLAWH
jgi:hypothetical protein